MGLSQNPSWQDEMAVIVACISLLSNRHFGKDNNELTTQRVQVPLLGPELKTQPLSLVTGSG